jgi:hypothetical protein
MVWDQLDVRNMPCYQRDSFDLVVDKGTLDNLMCNCGDEEEAQSCSTGKKIASKDQIKIKQFSRQFGSNVSAVQGMLREIFRVLTPAGHYVCCSLLQPSDLLPHLVCKV